MIWGKTIVIFSSFYFTYVHLEAKNHSGVFIFHFIMLLLHILPSFHLESTCVQGLRRLFLLRPGAESGLEIGCCIVPLVLLSQMVFGKKNKFILEDNWPVYHVAAVQMSLCTLLLLLILKGSRNLTNLTLLVIPLICHALVSTGNFYWRTDMCIPLLICLILYFTIFVITMKLSPQSFTLGEAMILSQTLAILFTDFSISILSRLHFVFHSSASTVNDQLSFNRTELTFILQTLLVGTLLTALLLLPVFYYLNCVSDSLELWIGSLSFYAVLLLSFIAIFLPSFYTTLGGTNPVIWLYQFFYHRPIRIYLILFWCLIVLLALGTVAWRTHSDHDKSIQRLPNIISRKIFHVLAVIIFVSGIIYDPSLLHLCSSAAAALFLFVELIRYGRVKPFGDILHKYLTPFVDHRDSGPLIFTHLYLLVGCSLPLWLYPMDYHTRSGHDILLYAGVLCIGLGDAAASVVGMRFGKHRWKGTNKTWEGTAGSILVQFCALFVLFVLGVRFNVVPVAVVVVLSSLLEAFTTQIDNFVLPPFTYALLAMTCSTR